MDGNKLLWDSCIFYAVLKGEDRRSGELEILQERVNDFNEGNLVIVASTLLLVEVRQSKLDSKKMDIFDRMLDRSNLELADVNPIIAKRAATLRNELHNDQGKYMSTPDAIHVATAIEFGVEMRTTDSKDTSNSAGILSLAEKIKSKYDIVVCRPSGQAAIRDLHPQ